MVVVVEEVVDTVVVVVVAAVVEVGVPVVGIVEFIVVLISFGWVVFTLLVVAPSTVVAIEKKTLYVVDLYSTRAVIIRS